MSAYRADRTASGLDRAVLQALGQVVEPHVAVGVDVEQFLHCIAPSSGAGPSACGDARGLAGGPGMR